MLSIENVTCTLASTPVLHGVCLTVHHREILCLLGPSGCGKTTLLRIIAGLETPDSGDVRLRGHSILDVPVHQRGFGLMFQENALFPHLTVADNVAFGLRMKGIPRHQRQQRLGHILSLVGLEGFEQRDVTALSGGEQQRVALARSLAPEPHLLMLDEPLGALDAMLRKQLVTELRTLIKRSQQTAIYVTHDQQEAFAVADRIAVMNAGRIEQVDTAEALYRHPANAEVAAFLGHDNILPVLDSSPTEVKTAIGTFAVGGQPALILLHPDGFSTADGEGPNAIAGRVTQKVFAGNHYEVEIAVETSRETAARLNFTLPATAGMAPETGERIVVQIRPEYILGLAS